MKRNKTGQFVKGEMVGENNNKWKGNLVGYFGVHAWIYRQLGKADICEDCGSVKNVQWANISGKYKRNNRSS